MNNKRKLILALVASLTLGLAPFSPEPHLFGKIKWIMGGGEGMQLIDYWDTIMHGAPWMFLIYFAWKQFFSSSQKEIMNQMKEMVNDPKTYIIDVREVSEFNSGHYKGAVNIPLSQLGSYVDKIKKMEGNKILYCRSGNRSGQAIKMLQGAGLKDMYNGGGLSDMNGLG